MGYVLITGGTTGIGFELAKLFAKDHYGVILVSSNQKKLESAKKEILKSVDAEIVTYEQDLGELGAARALVQKIQADHRKISILVNNAGIGLVGATEEIPLKREESLLLLNVVNLVELCKLLLPDMYASGYGKILNISSTGAFQPGPYTSTYFASKAFVLNYSRAIRYEARSHGVWVCVLCPGATRTNFFKQEGTKIPKNAMAAEKVASYAYARLKKKKEISIAGVVNRVIRYFVPTKIKMLAVAKMKNPMSL